MRTTDYYLYVRVDGGEIRQATREEQARFQQFDYQREVRLPEMAGPPVVADGSLETT